MHTTDSLCAPEQYLSPVVADQIFTETLSAMGGYALLQDALDIRPSFLCRGMEGELIMHFNSCARCSKVKIELSEEIDSYTLTFYRFSRAAVDRGCQVVEVLDDIDRSQLQHYFEEFTGLFLMPREIPS
jgi:hypothetical protein